MSCTFIIRESQSWKTWRYSAVRCFVFRASSAHSFAAARAQGFTGLKAIYLDSNAITTIENISHMRELRCMYVSKNILHDLDGIAALTALQTLDVSHNDLRDLAPLAALDKLQTLNASHNKLADAQCITPLRHCLHLRALDLEGNRLVHPDVLDVIVNLPLSLLRLLGNPVVSKTR
jgi:Leucine-rich repeat (LRR) protein